MIKFFSLLFLLNINFLLKELNNEIIVETSKAVGEKCNVCWKIKKGKCERHG